MLIRSTDWPSQSSRNFTLFLLFFSSSSLPVVYISIMDTQHGIANKNLEGLKKKKKKEELRGHHVLPPSLTDKNQRLKTLLKSHKQAYTWDWKLLVAMV